MLRGLEIAVPEERDPAQLVDWLAKVASGRDPGAPKPPAA